NELQSRKTSWKDMSEGIMRFTVGLAKKAVFANHCGEIADQLLASETLGGRSASALWLGVFAYSLQIYLDFSAYSDMAIGMGRMVGFHYKENFNYPYISRSVTEFWRRWHMSLSSFFRDYVYIPLGGNRCKRMRQIFNMLVVWLLTGFWHGASWNYVLWGLYFFVFLVVEKTVLSKWLDRLPRFVGHLYLLVVIFFGWALFRMEDLGELGVVLGGMFGFGGRALSDTETSLLFMNNWVFLIAAVVACTPLVKYSSNILKNAAKEYDAMYVVDTIVRTAAPILLLLLATCMLVGNQYNPFIYFQF
ncbi:MAG: MBOAT family protein, partial [Clostridia bacterium]|nr:MBOAT family protein [Clostridia bacterium]